MIVLIDVNHLQLDIYHLSLREDTNCLLGQKVKVTGEGSLCLPLFGFIHCIEISHLYHSSLKIDPY